MPTGYTAKLYDDHPQTFEEFALDCARAFAYWTKDTSFDESFPDPPEQSFSQRYLKTKEQELAHLLSLSSDEILREHEKEYWRIRAANQKRRENNAALRARYNAMLAQVEAWESPSELHDGLKKYMISQLTDSIEHDCNDWDMRINPKPFEWHDERIAQAQKFVDRSAEEAEKEIERNKQNKLWTTQLRESLSVKAS